MDRDVGAIKGICRSISAEYGMSAGISVAERGCELLTGVERGNQSNCRAYVLLNVRRSLEELTSNSHFCVRLSMLLVHSKVHNDIVLG